jgi:hypothetical protein
LDLDRRRDGPPLAALIDREGQRLLSRRVINDEPDLVALIDMITSANAQVIRTRFIA